MWVPNNRFLRANGQVDPKEDALRYMARCSRPNLYREKAPFFGLPEFEYSLMEAFYDNASETYEFLDAVGALQTMSKSLPDYLATPIDKLPIGRMLTSKQPNGNNGSGAEIIRQFKTWIETKKVTVLMKHRARALIRNVKGEIVGLRVLGSDGQEVSLRARKAVIFASGGYAHNESMIRNFQPGPIYGSCAVPTSEGDFVTIAQAAGAKLGNMVNAWRMQLVLEHTLEMRSVPAGLWQPPGDSMIIVNKFGRRVVNEKHNYHDRARVHFDWDPNVGEYPNQFLFMIYDRRVAELYASDFPLPAAGSDASYVMKAETLDDLGKAIQARLDKNVGEWGEVRLKNFSDTLRKTIANFDRYAKTGTDEEFQRGSFVWDVSLQSLYPQQTGTSWKTGEMPSATMHPFQPKGPYYAIILASGVLDTNGGPVINSKAQILDLSDTPIPGLYGAGNCISSPAAQAYWGPGTTLGLAITYGNLAGVNSANEPVKDAANLPVSA